jgi:hypothetical protein
MGQPNEQPIRLYAALTSAAVTAYGLAYMFHSEWGLSRIRVREDALAMVGLLVVAMTLKIVFQRKNNKGS